MHKKISKTRKSRSAPWEYFDDCHICYAMKEADRQGKELGEVELKEAFRKQDKKQQNY